MTPGSSSVQKETEEVITHGFMAPHKVVSGGSLFLFSSTPPAKEAGSYLARAPLSPSKPLPPQISTWGGAPGPLFICKAEITVMKPPSRLHLTCIKTLAQCPALNLHCFLTSQGHSGGGGGGVQPKNGKFSKVLWKTASPSGMLLETREHRP